MDAQTYQSLYSRTLAPTFFGDTVSPSYIGSLLTSRQHTAELVDAVKRGLFYGNVKKLEELGAAVDAVNDLDETHTVDAQLLHAVLGLEGEVAEVTSAVLFEGLSPGHIRGRVMDECGDILWYMALLFDRLEIGFEEVFGKNIDKLAKRYLDKFSTKLAVERDLEAEADVFTDGGWTPEEKIQLDGAEITISGHDATYTPTMH